MIRPLSTGYRDDTDARARKILIWVIAFSIVASALHRSSAVITARAWLIAPLQPLLTFSGTFRSGLVESLENKRVLGKMETADGAKLSVALSEVDALRKELDQLKRTAGLPLSTSTTGTVAAIIAEISTPFQKSLTFNKGTMDGIRRGAIVLSADGVVGRIVEAGPKSSKARTILDPAFRVAAEIDDHAGFVLFGAGASGPGTAKIDFVPRDIFIRPGARVVTGKEGTLFPAGLLLGHVKSVAPGEGVFADVTVEPAVSAASLRYVWIATTK